LVDLFTALPGAIRLMRRPDTDVVLFRQRQLRALATVDIVMPGEMVVANVYRAGRREGADVSDARPSLAAALPLSPT